MSICFGECVVVCMLFVWSDEVLDVIIILECIVFLILEMIVFFVLRCFGLFFCIKLILCSWVKLFVIIGEGVVG